MMREFNFTTTPIVDIVNDIIVDSVVKNASDIHFDPAEKYLKIRIRIDGELRDYALVDNKYKRNLTTRIKLLAGMNITESRLPQDGAIKSVIQNKDLDLRVSALPTSFGEKIVIRILDYSMSLQGMEYLGFTHDNFNILMDLVNSPNGIILITGATGSGKSTTVYSMLQKLNKEETNIITVEDPVEMSIEGLNQVQVNSEIGLDFANVLRSILRQDPNVILIGEIRDSETAKIAIRASITGHLVLSTLHTNNSLTTIERLIDMDVERYLLSSSLKGIISQTLAKKLCPACKYQRPTDEMEKSIFKKVLGVNVDNIYEAKGCDKCHNGYTGRIALQEVLMINDKIREAINNNIDREELRKLIYKTDVKTLLQDGLIKVIEGITDLKEVLKLVDYDETDNVYEEATNKTLDLTGNNVMLAEDTPPAPSQNNQIPNPTPNTNQNNNNLNINNNAAISNINNMNNAVNNQNGQPSAQPQVQIQPQNTTPQAQQPQNTPQPKPETNQQANSGIFANANGNLFDDKVFNNLNTNNTNNNTNYTQNLTNMINNNINPSNQGNNQ